jgi:hypothetical protein
MLNQTLINVLDWFHITKQFTIIDNFIEGERKTQLEKVKWHLWHRNGNTALERLSSLIPEMKEEKVDLLLNELIDYIELHQIKFFKNLSTRASAFETLPESCLPNF